MMTTTDVMERLAQHEMLGTAPREELAWLADHASFRAVEVGGMLSHKGQPVEGMFVILSGRLALFADRGEGLTKMVEWQAGDVTGFLPFSRMGNAPGDSVALEPMEILVLRREHIREMTRECFEVTSRLVHRMIDRTRLFTSSELHNEKMISLGKLSAGLAHELGNPASAIERSVCLITDRLEDCERAVRAMQSARLSDDQWRAVERFREACVVGKKRPVGSALEQVDREEAICDWLVSRGLSGSSAPLLAETGVTFNDLDALAAAISGPPLNAVLRSVSSAAAIRNLTSEVQGSSARISSLVMAIKGFTHMDQAMVADRLNPGLGLSDAVTVLNAKAIEKSVTVELELEKDLPPIAGFAGELNQIWGILLDNALDAAPTGGHVKVSAKHEGQRLVVHVIDNGAGIAPENRSRIFDPFFTTKPLGFGTGLGLDIARRLIRHNDGSIDFESQPGRTEFRVALPITGASDARFERSA